MKNGKKVCIGTRGSETCGRSAGLQHTEVGETAAATVTTVTTTGKTGKERKVSPGSAGCSGVADGRRWIGGEGGDTFIFYPLIIHWQFGCLGLNEVRQQRRRRRGKRSGINCHQICNIKDDNDDDNNDNNDNDNDNISSGQNFIFMWDDCAKDAINPDRGNRWQRACRVYISFSFSPPD